MEHLKVKVGGPYACFTRPEFSVERVSYDVMTPSAARGILEAIFWKPEFSYQVKEIWVLKEIRHFTLLRNELSDRQKEGHPFFIEDKRQQRTARILKDVEYLIIANVVLRQHAKEKSNSVDGYRDQFRRNVEKGRCYHQPYLGCREFAAWFKKPDRSEKPIEGLPESLGTMLFDRRYQVNPKQKELKFYRHISRNKKEVVEGTADAVFFEAKLTDGKLIVPQEKYKEVEVPDA